MALSRGDLRTLLDGLQELYAIGDLPAYRTRAIALLRRLTHAELATFGQIAPRERTLAWIADPPEAWFPGSEDVFARHLDDHPLLEHRLRTRDLRPLRFSDFVTRRQLRQRGLYVEFLRRVGAEYVISVPLRVGPSLVLSVALADPRHDFSEEQRDLLHRLRPHLVQGHRNAERLSRLRLDTALIAEAAEVSGTGLVFLSRGRVRAASPLARRWMTMYWDAPSRPSRLPDALSAWVRRLTEPLDDLPAVRAPLLLEGEDARLSVHLVSSGERTVLLFREQPKGVSSAQLHGLGLTARETEVLAWLARGKTNVEIAATLGTRRGTVAKHLERIYSKLGVENRTAAAARALGALATPGVGQSP